MKFVFTGTVNIESVNLSNNSINTNILINRPNSVSFSKWYSNSVFNAGQSFTDIQKVTMAYASLIKTVKIQFSADDNMRLYINGNYIGYNHMNGDYLSTTTITISNPFLNGENEIKSVVQEEKTPGEGTGYSLIIYFNYQ